jgi:NADPH:quinone reductase-like Zn-dependent oxidoreductase
MQTYHYASHSGHGAIVHEEAPMPEPGPGEVRVRVAAVSLNYRDLVMLDTRAGLGELNGRIPLSDGAGVVDANGPGAERYPVGTRVVASFFRDWLTGPFQTAYLEGEMGGVHTDGVLAEYIVLPETALLEIPVHLSFAEAAALPCAAVTAWNGLFARAGMKAGDTLVVQGTGGVALFGLQFAAAVGAEVILLSSSDEKLARGKEMGASVLINYTDQPDWDVAVNEATDGRGADLIMEVGGPGTYDRSVRSVAAGGTIIQIGVLTGFERTPEIRRITWLNGNIMGLTCGPAEHLEAVMAFLGKHTIEPVIDRTFAFDEAPQALEYLRSGAHFGKVLIGL